MGRLLYVRRSMRVRPYLKGKGSVNLDPAVNLSGNGGTASKTASCRFLALHLPGEGRLTRWVTVIPAQAGIHSSKKTRMARELYSGETLPGLEGLDTVYALDSSTIDLCLTVFPWAPFRSTKAAIKLHTLLDLRGNIPSFIHISDGKMHDVNILDHLVPEAGAFYVMDRGYVDYGRLAKLGDAGSFFVTRAKSNMKAKRRYSRPVDRTTGLICDQTIVLTGFYARQDFDRPLRRVKFNDPETGKALEVPYRFTMDSRFRGNDAAADRLVLAVAPTAGSRVNQNCTPAAFSAPASYPRRTACISHGHLIRRGLRLRTVQSVEGGAQSSVRRVKPK